MENNFKSNENKSLIWNLIYEQGGFNDIPDSRIDNIKVLLDTKVNNIINNVNFKNKSTIELNKILLKSLVDDLKIFRINENKTISYKKEENINEFNRKLQDHKNNMNDILKIKHPDTPNFEDTNTVNLNDINESYDMLIKIRSKENETINTNIDNNLKKSKNNNHLNNNEEKLNKSKTSFLDLSTELFKIDEDISRLPEEYENHINLSNLQKISPSKKLDIISSNRRSSVDSTESSESVLSINLDSIEYIDNNENNTIIFINKNLDQIKKLDKITNDKKNIDIKSDNNFNINNKLNIIINKIEDLSNKYNMLESKLNKFLKE